MTKAEQEMEQVQALFRRAYPLFSGVKQEIIGNVLARLMAGWLMGYRGKNQERTNLLRFEIMATLMMTVSEMVQTLNEHNADKLH